MNTGRMWNIPHSPFFFLVNMVALCKFFLSVTNRRDTHLTYPSTLPRKSASMSKSVEDITINYEEDGVLVVKETGKEILSKGAWTTILFRYQNWDKAKEEYSKDMFTIRRYQKRQGEYIPKSKFNISSREQAQSIIDTLQNWLKD